MGDKNHGSLILALQDYDLIGELRSTRGENLSPSGLLLLTGSCLNHIKWPAFNWHICPYSPSQAHLHHSCLCHRSNHPPAKVPFGLTGEGVVLYLTMTNTRWYFRMGFFCPNLTPHILVDGTRNEKGQSSYSPILPYSSGKPVWGPTLWQAAENNLLHQGKVGKGTNSAQRVDAQKLRRRPKSQTRDQETPRCEVFAHCCTLENRMTWKRWINYMPLPPVSSGCTLRHRATGL